MVFNLSFEALKSILHETIDGPTPLVVVSIHYFLKLLLASLLVLVASNVDESDGVRELERDTISEGTTIQCIIFVDYLVGVLSCQIQPIELLLEKVDYKGLVSQIVG